MNQFQLTGKLVRVTPREPELAEIIVENPDCKSMVRIYIMPNEYAVCRPHLRIGEWCEVTGYVRATRTANAVLVLARFSSRLSGSPHSPASGSL